MKNSRELIIGILAAATAGVIIGMLIAPEKGEDFRKTIRDTAADWAKKLRDMAEQGKEQTNALAESLEEGVNNIEGEVKKRKG